MLKKERKKKRYRTLICFLVEYKYNGMDSPAPAPSVALPTLGNPLRLITSACCSIIKMMESGLIDKWRRTWWSAKDVCSVEVAMSSVQSLKLDTTAGPFIIYACSTMLAVIILMSERAVNSLWPICKAMLARRATEV